MIKTSRTFRSASKLAAATVVGLAVASTAGVTAQAATTQPSSYKVETGWNSDWNGGCKAKATVTYYPGSNKVTMNTTVQSPYLFAACRVRTHLQVRTASTVFEGVDQKATACAVTDPSCASTIGTGDKTFTNASPTFADYVDDVNAALEDAGLQPTSRQALARGINVSFSKA